MRIHPLWCIWRPRTITYTKRIQRANQRLLIIAMFIQHAVQMPNVQYFRTSSKVVISQLPYWNLNWSLFQRTLLKTKNNKKLNNSLNGVIIRVVFPQAFAERLTPLPINRRITVPTLRMWACSHRPAEVRKIIFVRKKHINNRKVKYGFWRSF